MTDALLHPILPEVRLPAKLIPIMNHEEENTQREERYRISQDDTSIIRKEVNLLTSAVGEMKMEVMKVAEALQGNKFGNKGLIERIELVEEAADKLKKRIDDVIIHAKSRETYVRIIWGLLCALGGIIATVIIDRLTGKSPK
jgi:hypothetical protein